MNSEPRGDMSPRATYEAGASEHEESAARWRRSERRLSHARLIVFVLGLVIGWLAFGSHQIASGWMLPPALIFGLLIVLHERVIRRMKLAARNADFFRSGLARLDGEWQGQGESGENYFDPGHPYANDLDIFGSGSLFELLCTVRTSAGEGLLAQWLLEPATSEVAKRRQDAIRELIPRVELRRDLSLLGEEIGSGVTSQRLVEWGEAPSSLPGPAWRWIGGALTLLTLGGLGVWILSGAGAMPFLLALGLQSAFALVLRPKVTAALAAAEAPSQNLSVLAGLLARIEREPMESEHLEELSASLGGLKMPPSKRIAQLRGLMELIDARRNQFFAPFAGLLLWGTQMAFALESWRSSCGPTLGPWIETAAEIEVLCALSGYAYENPEYVFPEIVDSGAIFEGEGLGHPLIDGSDCVPNDLALGQGYQALVMSGSNMSGKSTMLRTVGCTAVLAFTGAPVRATALHISPLQIGASIRISDSLKEGTSHFLAEIKRLRQIVDLTDGDWPVLFLLDEVLHGTNSHDRQIGADAVLRGLLARGATGIVTTHDLALARIADHEELRVRNVHFQDSIDNGKMVFDYRLREGVVTRSNAIELMRSIGLDV